MKTSTPPRVRTIDHVHVYVADRTASEAWYERVLGFTRAKELEVWAADGGPLTVQNSEGTVHIALFERTPMKTGSTIAFGVGAVEYLEWRSHLAQELEKPPATEDHELSLSLYFTDPDANPYEITTYEHEAVRRALAASAA
jgi:catechol-2,3-dioxygenase